MPSYATLLQPIDCPFCHLVSAHEIQFLQGYFPEASQIDIRLGEVLEENSFANNTQTDTAKSNLVRLRKALKKGFRTHGHSLCIQCDNTVVSLLALRDYRLVQIEVFPATIQNLLAQFPSCVFLNSNNDEDLIFLSQLLARHGAQRICQAVENLAKGYHDEKFWKKRTERTKKFLKKYPVLKDFFYLIDNEPSNKSSSSKTGRYTEELTSLLEDEDFFQALEHNQQNFLKEQSRRHADLKKYLEKTTAL